MDQVIRPVVPCLQRDESRDRGSLEVVRDADDGGLGDLREVDEGAFDLPRPDPLAGHVHDVVDAAHQPVVAVLVALRAVPGEVDAIPLREVGLHEPLPVAPDAAEHAGPRLADGEVAAADLHLFARLVQDAGIHAGEVHRRRSRLRAGKARERGDEDVAGLGLPPGVDDRAFLQPDVLLVPHPRFGVDRLADRPEEAERGEVPPLGIFGPPLHEGPDRGGRRVEDGDPVLLDHLPEAVLVGPVGGPLVHQDSRAVRERPVDAVAVAGGPADVGRAPEEVLVLEVEDVLRGRVNARQVAAGGVEDPLRLAGRARGVEDVERVLRVHRLVWAVGLGVVHQAVPPVVPPSLDVTRGLDAPLDDDDALDGRAAVEPLVGHPLERDDLAAAPPAVGSDEDLGVGVLDPVPERVGREPAEDDGVDRPDPGAGEHRDRCLGNHREVDADAVSLPDAELLQDVPELADLVVKLLVGVDPGIARLTFPDDGGLVAARAVEVAVEAVG